MKKIIITTLVITALIGLSANAQIPQNGLVAYYPFNGNANDESGNGNSGTVKGASLTTDRFGNSSSAFDFNGIDNMIEVPANNQFDFQNFTISTWIKRSKLTGWGCIISKSNWDNAAYETFALAVSDTVIQISIKNNSNCIAGFGWKKNKKTKPSEFDGDWQNIITTYDGNILKVFISGNLYSSLEINGPIDICSGGNIRIGAWWKYDTQYFKGQIDDIGIWDRALSSTEIQQLYSACSTTTAPTGNKNQTLSAGSTIADLTASGTNVQWYSESTGGTALASTTALVNGTTYYASQTVNGCESSTRLAVTVSLKYAQIPQNGLVAYYPFNGNANDESGNGLNGMVEGATLTIDRFGNQNSAYSFTTNQDIIIPNSDTLNLYPLTISLWYNVDSLKTDDNGNIFSKYVPTAWNGFQIVYADNRNVPNNGEIIDNGFGVSPWYLRNGNDRLIGYYNEPPFLQQNISSNTWYHYVFVVDDTGGKLYVNGQLIDTHSWTGSPGPSTCSYLWKIGGLYDKWFHGKIDDIGIWNRALSSTEIQQLYSACSTSAPTGNASQTLCSGSTIADLTATGTNIQWYSESTGGISLASTTALVSGTTYYASQTVNGYESATRLGVTVSLNNLSVSASSTTVCSGQSTTLTASSDVSTTFSVGSIGPSGGYVFYDQGSVINGWRYLEAAPTNIQNSSWGCGDVNISGATSLAIGSGLTNTNNIVNTCTTSTIAAKRCLDYSVNGYDDWYLPSQNEFAQIYKNLILNNLGNFNVGPIPSMGTLYWTSTQLTAASGSHCCLECDGNFYQYSKVYELYVRPIRQFSTGTPFSSYLWSTGETTASISVSPTSSTQYWVDVTTNGVTCRKYITITVNSTTTAPTGNSSQTFCSGSTVADLTALGTNIQWYSDSTGGTALASTTALVNGTTYYASQTVNGCESATRLAVAVTIPVVGTPTGATIQYFCGESTIASFVVNGANIKWYATPTGGAELPLTTLITNGTIYYASKTINNCESSTRFAVQGYIKNTTLTSSSGSICNGDSVTLNASDTSSNYTTYLWSTGGTTSSIVVFPQVSTTYWVDIFSHGSSCRKYITIIVDNTTISASNTNLCQPEVVSITVNVQDNSTLNSCSSTNLPTNLQTNLLAWYPFCGNVNDQTSNNHNGFVTGKTNYINDRNNNPSSSFFFDGSTKIQIPHSNSLNAFPFSVSAWVKSSDSIPGHIIDKYENATWTGWALSAEPKGTGHYLINRTNAMIWGYDDYPEFSTSPINDNKWHNLVFVADQYSGRIYLDGELQDTQLWRGSPGVANSTWPMIIGYYAHTYVGIGNNTGYFNGASDDIGVWSRALTDVEVQQLYSSQCATTFLWSTGETTQTINPSPNQTTQYWVDVTTNGVTVRKYITINVNSTTPPKGENNQTMAQGSTLANLGVTGQNILWYSSPFGNTPLPTNTPLFNETTYYASQTINGCESPYRLPVIVQITSSLDEILPIKLVYSPNPVIDVLNIKASIELKFVKVSNLLGQILIEQRFDSDDIQLNMSDVPTGTYFVIVGSDNKKGTFKILKK